MSIKIKCDIMFDITATGVKSHFNSARLPFKDKSGRTIDDIQQWNRSRNQQRNWETVNQLISLRTLPEEIIEPTLVVRDDKKLWSFSFVVESPGTIELDGDPVGALARDCQDVPMLTGLDEDQGIDACLIPGRNIYFEIVHDK